MKKTLVALLSVACVQATPYAGLKTGFSVLKMKPVLKAEVAGEQHIVSLFNNNLNAIELGILAGYQYDMSEKLALLAEADYEFSFKTLKKEEISTGDEYVVLDNENLSLRKKHAFGFMPALRYKVNDKIHTLFGVRFGVTQYEGKASYNDDQAGRTDTVTGRKFVVSVEPTIGAGFNMTDKLSARMTVGYVIGQKKKIVNNYATQEQIDVGINKAIHVKPRGWNVRFAVIRSF